MDLRTIGAIGVILTGCAGAGTCRAQVDLISTETLHGVVDVRAAAANGEPSFLDEGFGKARYGGDGGSGFEGTLELANATFEWTPRLNWDWSAVVDVIHQPGQEHAVDLDQAYVVFKPMRRPGTRMWFRAGLFYPPVSLENDGRAWSLTDTITPSAINSWVGEEVKVLGAEANVGQEIAGGEVVGTVGAFGFDDTAGTLLSFRGWALHDVQSQAFGSFDLPPLSTFIDGIQSDETYSTINVDHHVGFYGKVEWRPAREFSISAFYYDNRGDMTGVTEDLQWAWATRFLEMGLRWDVDKKTRVMAQALDGHTLMGFPTPGGRFVDMDFRSAYLLGARKVDRSTFTVRADHFDTHDNSTLTYGDTNERGWALTGAWRYPLSRLFDLRLEALYIDSTRPGRALADEAPHQAQTVLQSSLRLTF